MEENFNKITSWVFGIVFAICALTTILGIIFKNAWWHVPTLIVCSVLAFFFIREAITCKKEGGLTMFGRKKELQRKQGVIDSLKSQNSKLRVEIADKTKEANEALEAKEAERQELCDQLGEALDKIKELEKKNERLTNGLKTANRENRFLIRTNAHLAQKLNVRPAKSYIKQEKD